MIASEFSLDPVDVLDSDWFEFTVRLVAYELVVAEKQKQQEELERQNKAK